MEIRNVRPLWREMNDFSSSFAVDLTEWSGEGEMPHLIPLGKYMSIYFEMFSPRILARLSEAQLALEIDSLATPDKREEAQFKLIKEVLGGNPFEGRIGKERTLLRIAIYALLASRQKPSIDEGYSDFCNRVDARMRQWLNAHAMWGFFKLPEIELVESGIVREDVSSLPPFYLASSLLLVSP